ncbi:SSI family serine proteinase inhibitor [Modestobacter sp. SSW1-42]|uniref:SSI family serine proteinase inhibitor n=1 Tax=Modestobacter sp. SSW1-42 TaxID=596372 RepID=UPI003986729E
MRRIAVPVLLLPFAVLTACGGDGGGSATGSTGAPASSTAAASSGPADGELVVELVPEQGEAAQTYRLSCAGQPAGDLPDPAAACAQLAGQPDPFAELSADTMCTQLFGGPQTAHVTGRWAGEPVDLQLSRTDGCRIAQWDRLAALLPGPTG